MPLTRAATANRRGSLAHAHAHLGQSDSFVRQASVSSGDGAHPDQILPFENHSGDGKEHHLAGGASDVATECPQSERIFERNLEKCVLSGVAGCIWKKKVAILTPDKLVLANHCKGQHSDLHIVTDVIPLHGIKFYELEYEVTDLDMADRNQHAKLRIVTLSDGDNAGARFLLRMESESEPDDWLAALDQHVPRAQKMHAEKQVVAGGCGHRFALTRYRLKIAYKSYRFQSFVAMMVILGLVIDMTEAQYLPNEGTQLYQVYVLFDLLFTAFFTFEVGGLCRCFQPHARKTRTRTCTCTHACKKTHIILWILYLYSIIHMGRTSSKSTIHLPRK